MSRNPSRRTGRLGRAPSHPGASSATVCIARETVRRGRKLAAIISEGNDSDSDTPTRINPLQLLGALRQVKGNFSSLLYAQVSLNGQEIEAMVDTDATHNFILATAAARLGLKAEAHPSKVKAINSRVQTITGKVSGVTVRMGSWDGNVDLLVVPFMILS